MECIEKITPGVIGSADLDSKGGTDEPAAAVWEEIERLLVPGSVRGRKGGKGKGRS